MGRLQATHCWFTPTLSVKETGQENQEQVQTENTHFVWKRKKLTRVELPVLLLLVHSISTTTVCSHLVICCFFGCCQRTSTLPADDSF